MNDKQLHLDIQKAIDDNKSLQEVCDIMNIVEVFGSVQKFEDLIGIKINEMNLEDKTSVNSFVKIVSNY